MIPGFLGANIEGVLNPNSKEALNGNWNSLPKTVSSIGSRPEELFSARGHCLLDARG
jgi:hypothetical protein